MTLRRLSSSRLQGLADAGIFPFGECAGCGLYPAQVERLDDGFMAKCGRCGRRLGLDDVVFLDSVAAARRGWALERLG